MWDLETIKRLNAKKPHSKPEIQEDIPFLNPEDNMREDVLMVMLAYARYTFSEIDWDFEQLTVREKTLIRDQKTLDSIRLMSMSNVDKEL